MSSSIKLTNSSGKIVTITNPDTTSADVAVDLLNNAYTIATVDDFGTVPVGYTTVIVKDPDRGGIFVWSASGTANGGTVFAGVSGYWNRQYSGAVNVKWFGAVGDGITDDTVAIQNAIDYCILYSLALYLSEGRYIASKINGNGSGYSTPTVGQSPSPVKIYGDGRRTSFIIANPSYAYTVNDWLFKCNNTAGVTFSGLGFIAGTSTCQRGVDLSWIGGQSIEQPSTAPSNQNILDDFFIEGFNLFGINLDQFHDSPITRLWVRYTNAANVSLSMQGAGGQLIGSEIYVSGGRTEISCQNASFQNCGFFSGVRLVGGGYNHITFDGCHLFPDATNSVVIKSDAIGNSTRALVFDACYFHTTNWCIAGRFWQGAIFNSCFFGTGGVIFGSIEAAAGTGEVPKFIFNVCSFEGLDTPSSASNYLVQLDNIRNNDGTTSSRLYSDKVIINQDTDNGIDAIQVNGGGYIGGQAHRSYYTNSLSSGSSYAVPIPDGAIYHGLVTVRCSVGGLNNRNVGTYILEVFQGDGPHLKLLDLEGKGGASSSFSVSVSGTNLMINNISAYNFVYVLVSFK